MINANQITSSLLEKTLYLPISREDFQFSSRTRGKNFCDVGCTTASQVILLSSYQSLTLENCINDLMRSILLMLVTGNKAFKLKESNPSLYLVTDNQYGIKLDKISKVLEGSDVNFERVESRSKCTGCNISFNVCGAKFSFASTSSAERPKYKMTIGGKKVLTSNFVIDPFSDVILHEYLTFEGYESIKTETIHHDLSNYHDQRLLLQIRYLIISFQRLYRNQIHGKINLIEPPTALGRGMKWGTYNGK